MGIIGYIETLHGRVFITAIITYNDNSLLYYVVNLSNLMDRGKIANIRREQRVTYEYIHTYRIPTILHTLNAIIRRLPRWELGKSRRNERQGVRGRD